jgi:hypothetical protein
MLAAQDSHGAAPMSNLHSSERYLPDEPLPPYTHVPGVTPHPVSDPRGHSHGRPAERPAAPDPERWQECRGFLRGVDLFNAGYFWEAHEVWEGLWHACGRTGVVATFLKGLIKLAAAGVKHLQGNPAGVRSHACRATALFRGLAAADRLLGLRLAELAELAEAVCRAGWPQPGPLLVPAPRQD